MTIDLTEAIEAAARTLAARDGVRHLWPLLEDDVRVVIDAAAPLIERAARAYERANMAAIRAEDRALIGRYLKALRSSETRTGLYATGFRAAIDLMIARTEATVDA